MIPDIAWIVLGVVAYGAIGVVVASMAIYWKNPTVYNGDTERVDDTGVLIVTVAWPFAVLVAITLFAAWAIVDIATHLAERRTRDEDGNSEG